MLKTIFKYFLYSGFNITFKLNPFHWRLAFTFAKTNEVWEQDTLLIEFLPITIRLWINNGDW